jgi:hypothetical protein
MWMDLPKMHDLQAPAFVEKDKLFLSAMADQSCEFVKHWWDEHDS